MHLADAQGGPSGQQGPNAARGELHLEECNAQYRVAQDVKGEELRQATSLYKLLLVNRATAIENQAKVAELFSVPRVPKIIRAGMSLGRRVTFDLNGDIDGWSWNFLKASDRKEALARICEQKPHRVLGSPPCTLFSQLRQWTYRRMHPSRSGAAWWRAGCS